MIERIAEGMLCSPRLQRHHRSQELLHSLRPNASCAWGVRRGRLQDGVGLGSVEVENGRPQGFSPISIGRGCRLDDAVQGEDDLVFISALGAEEFAGDCGREF